MEEDALMDTMQLPSVRSYEEEMAFIRQISPCKYSILPGFVPNMRVPGVFYVNEQLKYTFDERSERCKPF